MNPRPGEPALPESRLGRQSCEVRQVHSSCRSTSNLLGYLTAYHGRQRATSVRSHYLCFFS
jgi:hypothetical protein